MEEFLRSHAGTFTLVLVCAVFTGGIGLLWGWKPVVIALGAALPALLIVIAWTVGNQVAVFLIGVGLISYILFWSMSWWKQRQISR